MKLFDRWFKRKKEEEKPKEFFGETMVESMLSNMLKTASENMFATSFGKTEVEGDDHPLYEGKSPQLKSKFDQGLWDRILPKKVKPGDKLLVKMLREDLSEEYEETMFWLFHRHRNEAKWHVAKADGSEEEQKRLEIEGIRIQKFLNASNERFWLHANEYLNLWSTMSMGIRSAEHGYCLVVPQKEDEK